MCEHCDPYKEIWIDGKCGNACITKDAELVVFPDTDFEVCATEIKINYCPMCGRNLHEGAKDA